MGVGVGWRWAKGGNGKSIIVSTKQRKFKKTIKNREGRREVKKNTAKKKKKRFSTHFPLTSH